MDLIAKAVTLKSIKLSDPTAKNLLFSAKHSVLYTFDPQSSNWEKTETEGCLAIYKRAKLLKSLPSVHVLFILNRLRPENFSCPLSEIESVQLEGDLLMLLLKNGKVMGIWLFDERERQLALNVVESKLKGEESDEDDEGSTTNLKPISVSDLLNHEPTPSPSASQSPSILEILSKAKTVQPPSEEREDSPSLDTVIADKFADLHPSTSLKSFTNSVCQFLQADPQILASLHRQLTNKNKE